MPYVEGAVIAAAGLGSRVGLGIPKCLIDVDGQTILSRTIACLRGLVPQIHVVVGYREELVIDHCAQHHRDVIIVRNPNFRTTMTSQSYALGARPFSGSVLYLDGDLLLEREQVEGFLKAAETVPILVGLTKVKSEHAVFAKTSQADQSLKVTNFSYEHREPNEWANIVSAPAHLFERSEGHVFQTLADYLPLPAHVLDVLEIDTQQDLQAVRAKYEASL